MIRFDVLTLDRDLRRTAESWRRWQRTLEQGGAVDWDPFVGSPDVARQATFDAVAELDEADPLRRPLRRWIYRLTEQRIDCQGLVRLTWMRRHARHPRDQPEPGEYTVAELAKRFVADAPRRERWLEALESVSDELSRGEGLLWERRQEIAHRLGLDDPDEMECPTGAVAAAERWLTTTDDFVADLDSGTWTRWMETALAAGAVEGWPARLTSRSLANLLRETTWLDRVSLDPGELPDAIGPASFVRALARVGCAWGEALASSHQPFVVAHDPYRLGSEGFGALFASLPLHPEFVRRSLDVGAPRIRDHLRATARSTLVASRLAAARVLLRRPALSGTRALRDAYPEILRRAAGLPLSERLAGVLVRLDVDDGARFAGLLLGAVRREQQLERHDEDWFRNPRAAEALRAEAELSPPDDVPSVDLDLGIEAWTRLLGSLW